MLPTCGLVSCWPVQEPPEGSSIGFRQDSGQHETSFAWAIMRAADILVVAAMEFKGYAMESSFQVRC